MELKKVEPGYPCHKYLARNIKTEQDLWMYAKAFITTAVSQKTEWSEAISLLIASLADMPSSTGIQCPDFANVRLTPKDSCLFIMNNDEVPAFKSCNGYYRKKDSKTPCCRICPISNIYYNYNEKQEYEVLKFIFKNKDNFDFAVEYFDEDYFKSGIDVTMELSMNKGCVVPVLKEIVSSALKSNLRLLLFDNETSCLSNATAFDLAWDDAITRFPRERRIPAKLKNNPMWANVLKQYIFDRMSGAADITEDDVRDIFREYIEASLQQGSGKKEKEPVWMDIHLSDVPEPDPVEIPSAEKMSDIPLPDSDEQTNMEQTNEIASPADSDKVPNEHSAPLPGSDLSITALEPNILKVSLGTDMTGDEKTISPETGETVSPINGDAGIYFDPDGDAISYHTDDTVNIQSEQQELSDSKTDPSDHAQRPVDAIQEESTTWNEPSAHATQSENKCGMQNDGEVAGNSTLLTMNRDMILSLSLSPESINTYCEVVVNGCLPEKVYQGILRDKSVSIEVVKTASDHKYAYLVWSRHTKNYYLIPADGKEGNIYEILSRNMITKICHTPYLLYGISRLYHHTVKNVFSIQTIHSRVTEKAAVMSYESIIAIYDMEHTFGRGIELKKKEACAFFAGMPFYKGIAHVLTDMLDHYEKPLLYDMDRCVDESIGYSFLYARNFKDSGYLMQLLPDGRQLFKEEFVRSALCTGYFISYTVSNRNCATDIFRYLLYALSRDGHMRKCNLQITGMQNTYITFFVSDQYYDYITTIINMYLFEYSSLYPSQEIRINQLTERYK